MSEFGREVRRRRSELGLSQAALVSDRTLSLATLGAIERGEPRNFTGPSLAALDKLLKWEIGHSQAALDKERNAAVERPAAGESAPSDELVELLRRNNELLEQLAHRPPWAEELSRLAAALTPDDVTLVMGLVRRLAAASLGRPRAVGE